MDNRPIVILGMQGSGTAEVSAALARLGVFFGSEGELLSSEGELAFQRRDLTALNQKCLAFFQMHAASVGGLPDAWNAYPQTKILTDELRSILSSKLAAKTLWGLNQPLTTLLTPLYAKVFDDLELSPQFVVCVRHPLEAAPIEANWNYRARPDHSETVGLGSWLRYALGSLEAALGHPSTLVPFEAICDSPRRFLEDIVRHQKAWTPSEGDWAAVLKPLRAAAEPVRGPAGSSLDTCPTLVKDVFELCSRLEQDDTRVRTLLREYQAWRQMFAPPGLAGTRLGFAWRQGGAIESAQQPIMPAGDWQTVRVGIAAPAGTVLNGLLYSAPCRVWIRRCLFRSGASQSVASISPGPGSDLNVVNGLLRLDGAYEARQINLVTPAEPGPYVLELDILLESGPQIAAESVARLSNRLHQCAARRAAQIAPRRQD